VIAADGTETPVSEVESDEPNVLVRVRSDGFWLLTQSDVVDDATKERDYALWHIAEDGTRTEVGAYSGLPDPTAELTGQWAEFALDDSGDLFMLGVDLVTDDNVVIRRPLLPGEPEVVYVGRSWGSDLTKKPPEMRALINSDYPEDFTYLVTGP
jgi:hypothetical protein